MDTYARTRRPRHDSTCVSDRPEPGRADIVMADWLTLLAAVTGRLRMTAARQSTVSNDEHALDASGRLRADVLECVDALDQLHAALARTQRPL
jgi:hypothetical protein